jgi:hypothetical protein
MLRYEGHNGQVGWIEICREKNEGRYMLLDGAARRSVLVLRAMDAGELCVVMWRHTEFSG